MLARLTALAAFAIAASSCAADTDPWPGRYRGSQFVTWTACDGMTGTFTNGGIEYVLERSDSGELFVNDVCLTTYSDLSSRSARIEPTACDTTVDGVALHFAIVNGLATLDGDRLTVDLAYDVTGGDCFTASSQFIGDRFE